MLFRSYRMGGGSVLNGINNRNSSLDEMNRNFRLDRIEQNTREIKNKMDYRR